VTSLDSPLPTLADASEQLRTGRLSAVELTELVLARVEEHDGRLNSYLHVGAEDALRQARAADARSERRALHGIPVCVKDVIDVRGMATTAGSAAWSRTPARDAEAVSRLRAAGAIVLGKGNTNEFAYGIDGRNPHRGDCANPLDPDRMAGGSSSGPAAATAAGLALAGLGTDTSGSLRVPASFCGLVGIRPTAGSVPRTGVVPLSWSYDTIGPLARTVADAALLLDVLTGAPVAPAPAPEVRGLRVGLVQELLALASGAIADGVRAAAQRLEHAGAHVVPVSLPSLAGAAAIQRIVQGAEASHAHAGWFEAQRERYAPEVRTRLEAGALVSASAYLTAQQARRRLIHDVADQIAGIDVLLAPSAPVTAPLLTAEQVSVNGRSLALRAALLSCVAPISQLDCPSMSVPIGTDDGMPFGLQIFGRPFSEPLLLRVGTAVQRLA
jgi:aspartyl-tRNA(Asn)/glutamyl-tRNA(Gln) amidotransferase subunit A